MFNFSHGLEGIDCGRFEIMADDSIGYSYDVPTEGLLLGALKLLLTSFDTFVLEYIITILKW